LEQVDLKKKGVFDKISNLLGFDSRYFLVNSFYTFFSTFFLTIFNFIIIILLTNYCTVEIYGQYTYILSIVSIFEVISLSGFQTAILESSSKGYGSSLKKGTYYRLIGSIFIIPINLILSFIFLNSGNAEFGWIFITLAFILPVMFPFINYMFYLNGIKQFKLNFYFSIIELVVGVSLITLIIVFFQNNLYVIIIGRFLLLSVLYLGFWILTYKKKSKVDTIKDEKFFKYGLFLSGMNVLSMIFLNVDNIFIGTFLSFESLAIYSIAIKIPMTIILQMSFINQIVIPKLGEKKQDIILFTKKQISISIILGVVIVLILIISLPILIPILFSTQYTDSIIFSQIYSLGYIFYILDINIFNIFILERRQKAIVLVNLLFYCSFYILFPVLFYFFNLYGMILSRVLSMYLKILILIIFYKHRKKKVNK